MPNSLCFLPWVHLEQPIVCGPVRLLPYRRGLGPGDLPHATQADIDSVLSAYAVRPGKPVSRAVLVELGDWQTGLDAGPVVPELFRVRELLAFAALAERKLFRASPEYCNYDCFAMTVQRYEAGSAGAFSFTTRRRDGGASQLWGVEDFAFARPIHVPSHVPVKLSEPVLLSLLDAAPQGSNLYSAITDFNRANTDSADVPQHIELVMMKSAFEFLLDVGHRDDQFATALNARVRLPSDGSHFNGPMAESWSKARPKAARPLEAWAREFCDWRGGAAHGKLRGGERYVWSEMAHLAFASILFPLLVHQELVRAGKMVEDERKTIELEFVEDYLMHDPFAPNSLDEDRLHAWSSVYTQTVLGEWMARRMRREMDSGSGHHQ
jgi:hypothetical protein